MTPRPPSRPPKRTGPCWIPGASRLSSSPPPSPSALQNPRASFSKGKGWNLYGDHTIYIYIYTATFPLNHFLLSQNIFLYQSKKFPVFGRFLIFLGGCFFLFPFSILVFLYVRPTVFLFVSCFPDFIVFVSVRPKYFSVSVF